jgi:hypothetical protein
VSLAALRGFTAVIPVLPASRVNHTTDLISLKVQNLGIPPLRVKNSYEAERKDFFLNRKNYTTDLISLKVQILGYRHVLKGRCHKIFDLRFSTVLGSVSPKPLIIPLEPFRIFF